MNERDAGEQSTRIQPATFEPPTPEPRRRRIPLAVFRLLTIGGVALACVLAVAMAVQFVRVDIEPQPETLTLGGAAIRYGDGFLALPGEHRLQASREGFHALEEIVRVPWLGKTRVERSLTPLPGRLSVASAPAGARVAVNGERVGRTPLQAIELEPGSYELEITADGYQTARRSLEIHGRDRAQRVEVELSRPAAHVVVKSMPEGARLHVDGVPSGRTPTTVEVRPDRDTELRLSMEGYHTIRRTVRVPRATEQTIRGILEKRTPQRREDEQEESARPAGEEASARAPEASGGREQASPRASASGRRRGAPQAGRAEADTGSAPEPSARDGEPPGLPSGRNDSIVAKQLREAARAESDPELRDRLWREYLELKRSGRAR